MPVFCNVLWDTRDTAVSCDRGDIVLGFCNACSFVFNTVFDPALVRYSQSYDNCLHFSGRFRDYADALAERLVERHGLHGKLVVDVGCGKGDFLKLLCEKGPNRGVGYDPSFEARDDIAALGDGVKIVNDYYSGAYAGHGGDFLCCRHVLEQGPTRSRTYSSGTSSTSTPATSPANRCAGCSKHPGSPFHR